MTPEQGKLTSALVLPGGGARGAFQVGVLKAVAELVPIDADNAERELQDLGEIARESDCYGFAALSQG